LRQLAGARRQLFDLKTPIELKNPRRAKEVLDPSSIDEIYLISVLMGKGEELFSFIELIKTYTAHVFTRDFTQIVLTELDTISDFTAYLRDKDSVVQQNRHIMIQGGEEELLAFYLLNGRSFARFEEATAILIDDGSWQHFQEGKQYIAKKKEDEISYGWDYIINRVNEGFANYEPIARELARPTRFQRRVLSKGFFDAQLRAHADDTANVYRRVMPFEGVTYCFLFCAEGPSNETREKMLEATCRVARGRFQENTIVLGIATEKHIAPECSYSFCLLELPEWTDESQALMDEIQREFGILVDPSLTEVEEREYPS
jgi:hypothetical protein